LFRLSIFFFAPCPANLRSSCVLPVWAPTSSRPCWTVSLLVCVSTGFFFPLSLGLVPLFSSAPSWEDSIVFLSKSVPRLARPSTGFSLFPPGVVQRGPHLPLPLPAEDRVTVIFLLGHFFLLTPGSFRFLFSWAYCSTTPPSLA